MVKNLLATQKTQVQYLGWEDTLKKGMTACSSILAWTRGTWWVTFLGVTPFFGVTKTCTRLSIKVEKIIKIKDVIGTF